MCAKSKTVKSHNRIGETEQKSMDRTQLGRNATGENTCSA